MDTFKIRSEIFNFLSYLDEVDKIWNDMENGKPVDEFTLIRVSNTAKKKAISLEKNISQFKKEIRF